MTRQYLRRTIAVLSAFLCADACVPKAGSADGLTWQPVSVSSETIQTPNEITTQPNISNPCESAPAPNDSAPAGPPVISKFGQLDLDSYATGVAWSPDGRYIATSEDYDRIIKIWGFPSLSLLHTIDKGQAGDLTNQNLLFTHDGKYLITASIVPYNLKVSSALSIFDVETGVFYRNVPGYESSPRADQPFDFHLSPDGKFLFFGFIIDNRNEYVYETSLWSLLNRFSVSPESIQSGPGPDQATFIQYGPIKKDNPEDPNSRYEFVIWDEAKRVFIFKTNIFFESEFPVSAMAYNSSSCTFDFGSSPSIAGSGIKIWDPKSGKVYDLNSQISISDMSISSQQNVLGFITDASEFRLFYFDQYQVPSVGELIELNDIRSPFNLSFSADGDFLATAGDSKVVIYRVGSK